MQIQTDVSLRPYNTFGIEAKTSQFISIKKVSELQRLIQSGYLNDKSVFILGGGSNILLKKDYTGVILKIDLKRIEIKLSKENYVWVKASAGENWHQLVLWTLENNYYGLENLSLIPGTVGASPIQNIGAYGIEIKDVFYELEAINMSTGQLERFSKEECQFGYRNSIFKNKVKGQYCITSVTYQLSTTPKLNTNYGAIRQQLNKMGIVEKDWTPKNVSDAVIAIRSSKLPNPSEIGNSGSFFKNPEIPQSQFDILKEQFPNIVSYTLPNEMVKIPAGWLIEQCGWKGIIIGNTGTYHQQALVIVNHGGATGQEIYDLSEKILQSVQSKFGIKLTREVNVIE